MTPQHNNADAKGEGVVFPTPRTDAEVVLCNYGVYRVTADFARGLERELTIAHMRIAAEQHQSQVNAQVADNWRAEALKIHKEFMDFCEARSAQLSERTFLTSP